MVLKMGHRGANGYEPENTLSSFKKAIELGVDYIELDVQVCKTGEVVVFHDAKVDRITSDKGYVADKTFQELRVLVLDEGETIPTLEEVLDLVDRKKKINIEIKGEGAAKPVFDILKKYIDIKGWTWDDFIISSFNHYELLDFQKLAPEVRIGAVIAGIPIGLAECAQKVNAYSLHLSKEFVNQKIIDDAHRRGIKVFVYTLNEPSDIEKIKAMGVEGIFSDFPDRL